MIVRDGGCDAILRREVWGGILFTGVIEEIE